MPTILQTVAANRRLLGVAEAAANRDVIAAYALVQRRLRRATQQVDYLVRSGRSVSPATVARAAEFRRMTEEAGALLRTAAATTEAVTGRVSRYAVGLARAPGAQATVTASAPVTLLPQAALEQMVLGSRSGPLRALLWRRAGDAAEQVAQELIRGVAEGWDARVVARRVVAVAGMEQHQALTVVRTEMMRAHREGFRADLLAGPHAGGGWTWVAQLDPLTCAVCWARHGTTWPATQPMATHPRCRCVMVATAALDAPLVTGVDRFAALGAGAQDQILGPGAGAAYRDGAVTLPGLVRVVRHPAWGPVAGRRSLVSLVGPGEAARYQGRGTPV